MAPISHTTGGPTQRETERRVAIERGKEARKMRTYYDTTVA
jgi:hypothetical protein